MEAKTEYNAGEQQRPRLTDHQLDIILDYLSECQRAGFGEVVLVVQGGKFRFIRKNVSTSAEENENPGG